MDVSSLSGCRVKVSWTETKGEHRKMLKKHLWGFDADWNSFLVEARPYKKKNRGDIQTTTKCRWGTSPAVCFMLKQWWSRNSQAVLNVGGTLACMPNQQYFSGRKWGWLDTL